MIDPAMFVPPDQWLADRMRKMSTSLTTKNVDKRCGDPVGGGAESGERRPIERAPCRDAGHGSASAAVYPTYSTKA
ncbi:hypothetical protein [Burkholderia pseudomallei]|uniref:hypothetical protein n=1 Tax=Burkholderia pseudomallei TaxID=28450 RepID=UPI003F672332